MCQSDNNPTIEQKIAVGHQLVFNVARNSSTRRRSSAGPLKHMYTSSVLMDVILNSDNIHKKLHIRIRNSLVKCHMSHDT